MSWYSIFYWLTVADGVKQFFDTVSSIFTVASVIMVIALIVVSSISVDNTTPESERESADNFLPTVRKFTKMCISICLVTWALYVFLPTKKDALLIVAGGAVGTFITKDTAAKQIPSEVMTLLRDKLRSEIKEIHITDQIKDSLASKTKEELIEMVKNKK